MEKFTYVSTIVLFDFLSADIALCSIAEIPISSVSAEEQKSRADIAASFQVIVYEHISSCFYIVSMTNYLSTIPYIATFSIYYHQIRIPAASRRIASGGEV